MICSVTLALVPTALQAPGTPLELSLAHPACSPSPEERAPFSATWKSSVPTR